jgi:hypothetical protein
MTEAAGSVPPLPTEIVFRSEQKSLIEKKAARGGLDDLASIP